MQTTARPNPGAARIAALPLGLVLGAALQLQQRELFDAPVYVLFLAFALVGWWFYARNSIPTSLVK